MRFGRWEELLALPRPASHLPVTIAMWHFARGSALAALDRVDEAVAEQTKFRKAVAALPEGTILQQSTAADGLAIADGILEGEISFRRGDIDHAVAALREAVEKEDSLRYIEPPDWLQPARHSLGAIHVAVDRLSAFRLPTPQFSLFPWYKRPPDLLRIRENPGLHGLVLTGFHLA